MSVSKEVLAYFAMILTVLGCDQLPISKKKDDAAKNGQPARITLQLSNSTHSLNITANARGCTSAGSVDDVTCYTPSNYEVKILHAYLLSSDETPSFQDSGLIWPNPVGGREPSFGRSEYHEGDYSDQGSCGIC